MIPPIEKGTFAPGGLDAALIVDLLVRVATALDAPDFDNALKTVLAPDVVIRIPDRLHLEGIDEFVTHLQRSADRALSHHVSNFHIERLSDDTARCTSKALTVRAGPKISAATFVDFVERSGSGWKVSRREILPIA